MRVSAICHTFAPSVRKALKSIKWENNFRSMMKKQSWTDFLMREI